VYQQWCEAHAKGDEAMKRWAVGYFNMFDNNLFIEIVTAADWLHALGEHSLIRGSGHLNEGFSDDMEAAKQEFFNQDAMFDCVEIT
jgi:hypothetical protein